MQRLEWLDAEKEEIIRLHREEGWTNQELGDYFNVAACTINTRLRKWKANISDTNRNRRINISEEDIRRMYWDEQMHPSQIAKKFNCKKQTITDKMKVYGIPSRTKSESKIGN